MVELRTSPRHSAQFCRVEDVSEEIRVINHADRGKKSGRRESSSTSGVNNCIVHCAWGTSEVMQDITTTLCFLIPTAHVVVPGHRSGIIRRRPRSLCGRFSRRASSVRLPLATAGRPGVPSDGAHDEAPRPGVPPFAASARPVSQESVDQWLRDVEEGDTAVRLRAVLACKDLSSERAAPILTKVFDKGEKELQNRGFAALFLGYKPNPRSFEILSGLVTSEKEADEVRANAVAALGYLRDPKAVPLCLSLLRDSNTHWCTRLSSAGALGMIVEMNRQIAPLIYDDLVEALRSVTPTDVALIPACIGALGDVGDARCVLDIANYLDAADFTVAQCACEALGKLPSEMTETVLTKLVEQKDGHVNVLWAAELALNSVRERLHY